MIDTIISANKGNERRLTMKVNLDGWILSGGFEIRFDGQDAFNDDHQMR
jgi:hypothetical protein